MKPAILWHYLVQIGILWLAYSMAYEKVYLQLCCLPWINHISWNKGCLLSWGITSLGGIWVWVYRMCRYSEREMVRGQWGWHMLRLALLWEKQRRGETGANGLLVLDVREQGSPSSFFGISVVLTNYTTKTKYNVKKRCLFSLLLTRMPLIWGETLTEEKVLVKWLLLLVMVCVLHKIFSAYWTALSPFSVPLQATTPLSSHSSPSLDVLVNSLLFVSFAFILPSLELSSCPVLFFLFFLIEV